MVVFEVVDDHTGLQEGGPAVAVQTLVAQSVVERLDEPVVPRRAGRNVGDPHRPCTKPLQGLRNELRPVVHTQHHWWATRDRERLFQLLDQAFCRNGAVDDVQQRHASVFIHHRRDLDLLPIDGGVELKVQCPHHFRCIRSDDRHGGLAGSFASRSTPHLQAFFSPQAVHFLLVDLDAVVETQVRPRPTEPVAWILAGIGA